MAIPQNPNGVFINTITNLEPTNLCCYQAKFPACINKNIFLSTTIIETEGANKSVGSLGNIVNALRGIEKSVKLLALDTAIAPNINPVLTAAEKLIISTGFKTTLA